MYTSSSQPFSAYSSWQKNIYFSSVPLTLGMFVQGMDYGILKTFVIVWQVPSFLGGTALPQRVQHPEGTSQPSTATQWLFVTESNMLRKPGEENLPKLSPNFHALHAKQLFFFSSSFFFLIVTQGSCNCYSVVLSTALMDTVPWRLKDSTLSF